MTGDDMPSPKVGTCKHCTGELKKNWLTKELFHAETGMNNCPFSTDKAELASKLDDR